MSKNYHITKLIGDSALIIRTPTILQLAKEALEHEMVQITREKSAVFEWEVSQERIIRESAEKRMRELCEKYDELRDILLTIGDIRNGGSS